MRTIDFIIATWSRRSIQISMTIRTSFVSGNISRGWAAVSPCPIEVLAFLDPSFERLQQTWRKAVQSMMSKTNPTLWSLDHFAFLNHANDRQTMTVA